VSRLYLHCVVCGRRQADGLISGAAWGRLEVPEEAAAGHPGLEGTTLRACPSCVDKSPDWQTGVWRSLGFAEPFPSVRAATAT
jgi:hypothetical protein